MEIAICDDNPNFRDELKEALFTYKKEKRVVLDIVEFQNGEELLHADTSFDLYIIDYQMPGRNGLEVAKELRKKNESCGIIFMTRFSHFVLDSFEVQPFRFFLKPLQKDKLYDALDSYIRKQRLMNPVIIDKNGELQMINADQIIYVEGDGKNCIIRTLDDFYHSAKTVSKFMDDLPFCCFYRIHKSYVVNMHYITAIYKNEVVFVNGEKAAISRNRLTDFKKAYKLFVKNNYLKV